MHLAGKAAMGSISVENAGSFMFFYVAIVVKRILQSVSYANSARRLSLAEVIETVTSR